MEVSQDVTYICTCYGEAQLNALSDAAQMELVRTTYHDSPRYVYAASSAKGALIVPAPVINHQDAELSYLEELVGRKTPFTGPSRY